MKIRALTYNVHGLPWSKNQSADIVRYLASASPDTICLQEVFLDSMRLYFSKELGARGYTVVVPRDEGVTMLNSGLLTAFRTSRFADAHRCYWTPTEDRLRIQFQHLLRTRIPSPAKAVALDHGAERKLCKTLRQVIQGRGGTVPI